MCVCHLDILRIADPGFHLPLPCRHLCSCMRSAVRFALALVSQRLLDDNVGWEAVPSVVA